MQTFTMLIARILKRDVNDNFEIFTESCEVTRDDTDNSTILYEISSNGINIASVGVDENLCAGGGCIDDDSDNDDYRSFDLITCQICLFEQGYRSAK